MRYSCYVNRTIAHLRGSYDIGRNAAREVVHCARDFGCALLRRSTISPQYDTLLYTDPTGYYTTIERRHLAPAIVQSAFSAMERAGR